MFEIKNAFRVLCGRKPAMALAACLIILSAGLPLPALAADKFHLEEATITDIQNAIKNKQITCVELVKLYLKRIKAYNGVSVKQPNGILGVIETIPHAGQINALQTLNLRPAARKEWGFEDRKARSMTDLTDNDPNMPDALEVAAELDRKFAETGKLVGPLHGVVFAIKDQYDTFDMRTTAGADVQWANDRPPRDGTPVHRLREAGAIILAKSNLGEYASGIPRSSFGGTFSNPYDTERSPMGSSSGSGTSVSANLVTCAIGEETGTSIRGPASYNSCVGIPATQELVSRDGMIDAGLNTRCGPICRTVEDAARVLDVIAGFDPHDEYTAFGVGRRPKEPYYTFAKATSLKGMRIGVVREYMDKKLFSKADEENIDIVNRAIEQLKKLGAEVIDPGEGNGLFNDIIRRYNAQLHNAAFTKKYPDLFPVDAEGKPTKDHVAILVAMGVDPSLAPKDITLRDLGQAQAVGENKYMLSRYLAQRGDANIKTIHDLITKATFFNDYRFGDRKATLESNEKPMVMDTAVRLQRRFAVQQMVLELMAEQNLDALVYPTENIPPPKLGAPIEPIVNGRSALWSFLGAQGFPVITVPAGFTTHVYDRVRDPSLPPIKPSARDVGTYTGGIVETVGSRLEGPVAAKLPVGVDFVGRPFGEPTILQIASAYEKATKNRIPPPDFGPLAGEP